MIAHIPNAGIANVTQGLIPSATEIYALGNL
jgi:hypothetical protein